MRLYFFITLLFITNSLFATDYNVNNIPAQLVKNSNAIIRLSNTEYNIPNVSEIITKRHYAVTVLNANGVNDGVIVIPYSNHTQIKSIKAAIYDADGKVLKRIKMSDFDDLSLISYFSLYEDDRMKIYKPQVSKLPYTVEYEVEIKTKSTFSLPKWSPQYKPGISVEKAVCCLTTPADFKIRYKTNKLKIESVEDVSKKQITYNCSLTNIPAWTEEPLSPPTETFTQWVHFAPVEFQISGIKGEINNWEDYGKWGYNNLLNNTKPPKELIATVEDLIVGIESPREKAEKIYEYCQQKNRYVSIQKGELGGIKPASVKQVYEVAYGDCKGLCNYMVALLDIAGIKSYYAEVYAGSMPKQFKADFPNANTGNHIIVYLPFENDTVWLECTSNKVPFGYLGDFTGNRNAVIYSENGGRLVNTTVYSSENNCQASVSEFLIDTVGNLTGKTSTSFKGFKYEKRPEGLNINKKKELKEIFNSFPELNITSYNIEHDRKNISVTENLVFKSERFASISRNRMYIPVNPVNKFRINLSDVTDRKNDIFIYNGFSDSDTIIFKFPEGYKPEAMPFTDSIEKDFGTYSFKTEIKGNYMRIIRLLQINNGTYPADRYNEFIEFFKKVSNKDNSKLILIKGKEAI